MDYTNFVRTYYRVAIQKLDEFAKYNGSIVDFHYALSIPEDKKHKVERKSSFLPDFDININAETRYFETFLDFYGSLYCDLGGILLDKVKLVKLYDVLMGGTDDEAILTAISVYVNAGVDYLKEDGVLA